MLSAVVACLFVGIVLPLYSMLVKSVQNSDGDFIGVENFAAYLQNPSLFNSVSNSLFVAGLATTLAVLLAFVYAYALTRTCMPWKFFFGAVAVIPLLSPSLLQAISLVYLFGNQGVIKGALLGNSIYGPIGIVAGLSMWAFPMALIIIKASLAASDGRLYEAATAMRTSAARVFFTVTLPGAKYGLISSMFVVFTLTFTDFGVAKVIGGNYGVLSTEIFFAIVGAQNDQGGAAVLAIVLLAFTLTAFYAQRRWVGKKSYVTVTGKGDAGLHAMLPKRLTWLIFATMYWAISNIGSVDCQLHDDAGSPFSFLDGIYFSMETQVRVSYCIGWSWAVGA